METCRGIGGCAAIRTLAWVVTRCRQDSTGKGFAGQDLLIRRGNCAPKTVVEFAGPSNPNLICRLFGQTRLGDNSVFGGVIQAVAVRPDGTGVVFEVADELAVGGPVLAPLPPEQEGIFFVRSDGSGLRRLGPSGRVPPIAGVFPWPLPPGFTTGDYRFPITMSPDGGTIALTDLGPGPAGEKAQQIVIMDVATGRRTQLTRLPAGTPYPGQFETCCGVFVNERTILFRSFANPDGLNPSGELALFTVRTDGTGLRKVTGTPVALPGARIEPTFSVSARGAALSSILLPDRPKANFVDSPTLSVKEVFLLGGRDVLQLTHFDRVDTNGRLLDDAGRRAFFVASADPLGKNPSGNCQLFSIDNLGSHVRQLTRFREGERSINGCLNGPPPDGCMVFVVYQDPATRTLVFYSSCDPFGTNPYGGQIFAMRPDGSKLRQLTTTRGLVEGADGEVTLELPGPFGYSARFVSR
jgi:hypothetical protein